MPKHHHRCSLCGRDFERGADLRAHVERRHPRRDVRYRIVAEEARQPLRYRRT